MTDLSIGSSDLPVAPAPVTSETLQQRIKESCETRAQRKAKLDRALDAAGRVVSDFKRTRTEFLTPFEGTPSPA